MKKAIEQKLAELQSEIREIEKEYPIHFPILEQWKIAAGKREVLTELYQLVKK